MKISGSLLKMGKGPAKSYSYKCFVHREAAKEFGFEEDDALLLKFKNTLFPTVFHKHKARSSFTYAFTIPRSIGDVINKKKSDFELIKVAKRVRKISSPKQQIDLLTNIKNRTKQGQPFYVFDLGEKVYIWVYSRGSKGFILNRFIPIKPQPNFDFFELMGAFHCEGKKSRKHGKNLDSMIFSNGDPEQILWFAESLKRFGFSKKDFSVKILHNETQNQELLKEFWSSHDFSEDKINFYENNSVKSEKGICLLTINGVAIGELFYELLKIAKRLATSNKHHALSFFRGLSRGDICVSKRGGSVANISYTTENQENAIFFRKICKKIGVECGRERFIPGIKGFWNVNIFGHENYKKLLASNAITHAKRKEKLLKLFFGMRNTRPAEYLAVVKGGNLTSQQIADVLGISVIGSRAFLQKLRTGGYLKKRKRSNAFIYALTDKGVRKLEEYEQIKQQMVE
ncbi:TPA: hypothetical protein HA243_06060 [Candidatus Micrarchaeota archaeon]|nr:hypothetical protein [Candidatus Micrarchaeota archaeon]